MSKIIFDEISTRLGETGVKNAVLYSIDENGNYTDGVAWNGLIAVNEAPTGAESTAFHADNMKYIELMSAEEFAASIEAFMYPDEFKPCIGEVEIEPGLIISQQNRKTFGFIYTSTVVNDSDGEIGYKLHLVYGAKASTSDVSRSTVNETPDLVTFSWDITTTPVLVTGYKPTAHFVIDTTKLAAEGKTKLALLEDQLFGKDGEEGSATIPNMPLPDAVVAMFA